MLAIIFGQGTTRRRRGAVWRRRWQHRVNEHIRLDNIPSDVQQYHVNGRTPREWFIDRCRITQDWKTGIVNDPNGWFDNPQGLGTAICCIVHLSVETTRIDASLPEPFADQDTDHGGGQI